MKIYFLLGLRRSGNHLFINIIINNYTRVLFYNDINYNSKKLSQHLIPKNSEVIGNDTIASKLINNLSENPECIIFSFEDLSLKQFNEMVTKIKFRLKFTQIIKCIIIRDLLNCIASRLEANNNELAPVNNTITQLWYTYFYSQLPKINYNLFLIDNNYKDEIKEILQLNQITEMNTVPLFFSGSSFNRNCTQKEENISYLTRYKKYFNEDYISNNNLDDIENYFQIKY